MLLRVICSLIPKNVCVFVIFVLRQIYYWPRVNTLLLYYFLVIIVIIIIIIIVIIIIIIIFSVEFL